MVPHTHLHVSMWPYELVEKTRILEHSKKLACGRNESKQSNEHTAELANVTPHTMAAAVNVSLAERGAWMRYIHIHIRSGRENCS